MKGGPMSQPIDPVYDRFVRAICALISENRIITDPLRTLAYGTDASFYRLMPRVVVKAETEAEVVCVLKTAHAMQLPVTFRAAGTSLSGQAVTDSILLMAGHNWTNYRILNDGAKILCSRALSAPRPTGCWRLSEKRSAPIRPPSTLP
jgi:D-lactate dehydrogenase